MRHHRSIANHLFKYSGKRVNTVKLHAGGIDEGGFVLIFTFTGLALLLYAQDTKTDLTYVQNIAMGQLL